MRVTVTQLPDIIDEATWAALGSHVGQHGTELLLLGELCFSEWLAVRRDANDDDWVTSLANHDQWIERLGELNVATIAGTRPVLSEDIPHNDAYVWTAETGARDDHRKCYLPDEAGFWEASWYRRGDGEFDPTDIAGTTGGFMICTDMWFTEHARAYARAGVGLLLVPRATPGDTTDRWLAGGRTAAVMSGAFCLSSNRSGYSGRMPWGALGWIIDPEGTVLATTSDAEPFVTVDIDLDEAGAAKMSYPRYVLE
jgi:N-carbamoylputrescine amidase